MVAGGASCGGAAREQKPTSATVPSKAPSPVVDTSVADASPAEAGQGDAELADAGADAPPKPPEPYVEEAPPRPKGQLYRPQGKCVDPQRHAAAQVAKAQRGTKADDWLDSVYVARDVDLDGDGTPDQIRNGGVANITATYFVYVMRGECGHFAGRIDVEANLDALDSYSHGLRDLGGLAACQPSCCEKLMYTELHFDGRRYRVAKKELRKVRDCPHFP